MQCELNDLKGVKTFAQRTLEKLGQDKIDYLLLNAAISNGSQEKGPHGSKWCESLIVNHFCESRLLLIPYRIILLLAYANDFKLIAQHYLLHLLRDKLVASKSRIVVVSSGAVRNVPDVSVLDKDVLGGSGLEGKTIYCETKFIQLLGAHWWRRQLAGQCDVVAVSPGLIPSTGISRGHNLQLPTNIPDAKSIPEGKHCLATYF